MRVPALAGARFFVSFQILNIIMSKNLNYLSPEVEVIEICAQSVMCQSWGGANDPGNVGDEDEGRIYNY